MRLYCAVLENLYLCEVPLLLRSCHIRVEQLWKAPDGSEALFELQWVFWSVFRRFVAFKWVLSGFDRFLKVLRRYLVFWDCQWCSEVFSLVLSSSERFLKFRGVLWLCEGIMKFSVVFWGVVMGSERFWKATKGFEAFSEILTCSDVLKGDLMGFWVVVKGSRTFWRHFMTFWGRPKAFWVVLMGSGSSERLLKVLRCSLTFRGVPNCYEAFSLVLSSYVR